MPSKLTKLERQIGILDVLRDEEGGGKTLSDLCELGDFDEKTIRRDLKQLAKLGAEISQSKKGKTVLYKLDNDFYLPNTLTARDLHDLTIFRLALKQHPNSVLDSKSRELVGKINKLVRYQRDYSDKQIDEAISFKPQPVQMVKPEIWEALLKATLDRNAVGVAYVDSKGVETNEDLFPYHMTCLEGEWYLLAGSRKKTEPRQYSMANILGVYPADGKFERPEGFSGNEVAGSAFGRFIGFGGSRKGIRVRISGHMVRYIKGRTYHPEQSITELDGGKSIEIRFPASDAGGVPFGNIVSWVLSMGPCAVALDPPELVARVKQEAEELLERYR